MVTYLSSYFCVIIGLIVIISGQTFNLNSDAEDSNDYNSYNDEVLTDLECEKLEPHTCDPTKVMDCPKTEQCKKQRGLEVACMSTWKNRTNEGVKMLAKGCWLHQKSPECDQSRCIATKANVHSSVDLTTFFCCCVGPFCNEKIFYEPPPATPAPPVTLAPEQSNLTEPWEAVLYILVPIVLLAMVVFVIFYYYRRYKACKYCEKHGPSLFLDGDLGTPPRLSPRQPAQLLPIQLREEDLIARGRFGRVYRAQMADQVVAVKKFPFEDGDSWIQEQEIYAVEGMKHHPNILNFIAAESRGSKESLEYWLVTQYHPNGSLSDYLKCHSLNPTDSLQISVSMLRGLSFLHEEILEKGELKKPAVVHRDFKSKNVMLKDDMTACIGDFGWALKCEHGQTSEDTHGQVGTRRYMAPEVLEGATEFSAVAFRQIDVYAAALVLWEILSRTHVAPGERVDEYRLPFEEELGLHPTLDQMQVTVVNNKQRPAEKESWRSDTRSRVICHTMEEMWDAEPEARISAGVALERLAALISSSDHPYHPAAHHHLPTSCGIRDSSVPADVAPGAPAIPGAGRQLTQIKTVEDLELAPLINNASSSTTSPA